MFEILEIAPEWSPVYSVDGEMIIPKAKVQQPFKAWYDAISGISRIDFYKGNNRKSKKITKF